MSCGGYNENENVICLQTNPSLAEDVAAYLRRRSARRAQMQKPILRHRQEIHRTRHYSTQPPQQPVTPRTASARASYPVFLSIPDTLKLQIGWAWRGLMDAFRWDVVIDLMTRHVEFLPFYSLARSIAVWCVIQRCRGPLERTQVVLTEQHLTGLNLRL